MWTDAAILCAALAVIGIAVMLWTGRRK